MRRDQETTVLGHMYLCITYIFSKVHCLYFEFKFVCSHMYHFLKILGLVSCVGEYFPV